MSSERTYWVTLAGEKEPFRVTLRPAGEGWEVAVGRDGGDHRFRLTRGPDEDRVWVADRPVRFRWQALGDRRARLHLDGVAHEARVVGDAEHRIEVLGMRVGKAETARSVRAPMPGLVLVVEVEEGQAVDAGAGVAIIEAMKMENEITAPIAGVVRGVSVEAGRTVERDEVLCRIEPRDSKDGDA